MVGPLSLFPCRLAFVSDHSIRGRITGLYNLSFILPSDVCSYYFSSCKRFLAVLFLSSLAACSRVLLLLLLSYHETCKCSFCFCVLLLLRASASVFMNFSRILSCCVMDELDVLGFDQWKTTLACIAIGWEWIEYILYVADFEFHTCWHFELYDKVCVRRRFDLLNIFIVFGGLEWAALGCSSNSRAAASSAAGSSSSRGVGRRQMLPGIGTLRGERTPGVWRAQGGGA